MYQINSNNNVKMVDTGLVNKILEQGQKLRNAMVGSILKNDPFNTDIIYNKHFNTPKTSCSELNDVRHIDPLTVLDEKRVEAYIKGEHMTKEEEKLVLDTLRSMSAPDLCKTTERTFNSTCLGSCKCYTCEIYNSNNLNCDLRRKHKDIDNNISEVTRDIQQKYKNENQKLLKYIDSLKVSINSFILNETGNRKILDNDKKVPYNFNQSYFLEYHIPDCIVNKSVVSKSKVDSGLENNYVRFCAKRSNNSISFKQITIHDLKNLDKCNLNECEIKFNISYRTQKQKHASTLGFAKFNFGSFLLSKNLVCNRSLSVYLKEDSPIVVGNLKVSILLGCGRLYFGQEFIDAINSVKSNSVVLDSDDSTSQLNTEPNNYNLTEHDAHNIKEQTCHNGYIVEEHKQTIRDSAPKKSVFTRTYHKQTGDTFPKSAELKYAKQTFTSKRPAENSLKNINKQGHDKSEYDTHINVQTIGNSVPHKVLKPQITENEKHVLFGFLYISEVQYLSPPICTYITCRPFCQSETSCSKLVTDTSNPVFNFSQLVPLIYEDELLQFFRENYMVIEFWKKVDSTDLVIGLTKIPLHQFYLAYRNPVFVKYLSKNKLPIIDTDWWEPIYSIDSEKILGQVEVLAALGTEEQVNNLKSERGFANNIVKAKFPTSQPRVKSEPKLTEKVNFREPYSAYKSKRQDIERDFLKLRSENKFKRNISDTGSITVQDQSSRSELKEKINSEDKAVNTSLSPKTVPTPRIQKIDIGVQSSIDRMDKTAETQDKIEISPTQEMLGSFLNQLMAQKQKNIFVENSTNTEAIEADRSSCSQSLQNAQSNTNLELRKTTDLLDSLQKALFLDGLPNSKSTEKKPGAFKARISINSANHLPSRKKCKSKKSRNRSMKNEDNVLPSSYVTFEMLGGALKITPVISKTTNPTWNYKCEANLPNDLLTNSQRRLIFKVWRKATNAVLSPNMQTDVVLGFAAVDLTVLLAGFPNVQGWFNIIDFTGKCNGQINIHVIPLENLSKYMLRKQQCSCDPATENVNKDVTKAEDEPSEVFSRALKRKFTELDEITQRLRLRLSKVTNDDSDTSSDGVAEEFERDINTLCIEEDFDLIDFDEEAKKLNVNHNNKEDVTTTESSTSKLQPLLTIREKCGSSKEDDQMQVSDENKISSSNTETSLSEQPGSILGLGNNSDKERELSTLDRHLQEGKQKIDTLLEKLSLISADTNHTFSSRYVSGCSLNNDSNAINIDTEAILKELDHYSRPNIQSSLGFEPLKFQQLYGGSDEGESSKNSGSSVSQTSNSDTSLITNFSECRPAPDGQGNVSEEKVVRK